MVDLINLQLRVCIMISERYQWAQIVTEADALLLKCLASVLATSQQEFICSVFMQYMIEFGLVWHGWCYTDAVTLEDKDILSSLIHFMERRLHDLGELEDELFDTSFMAGFNFETLMGSGDSFFRVNSAAEPCPMYGRDGSWEEADVFNDEDFDFSVVGLAPSVHSSASMFTPAFMKVIMANWSPRYSWGVGGSDIAGGAVGTVPELGDAGTGTRSASRPSAADKCKAAPIKSDLVDLTIKMQRFFATDSVAIFQSSFFPTYYRNPKHSIRGFPCLPGRVDYSETFYLQQTGRGGGAQDRVAVFLDVYLEASPQGGVWVVAEIQELETELGDAPHAETPSSCASLAELVTLFGAEAVVTQATPLDTSATTKGGESAAVPSHHHFCVNILPRTWKFTRSLHAKGTRRPRPFVLRVQVWVFSPRGVGVLATQVDSPSFVLSSTQNLRKQKKRESDDGSTTTAIEGAVKKKLKK
jgi:hypothetical protein